MEVTQLNDSENQDLTPSVKEGAINLEVKVYKLRPGRCEFCKTRLVVMDTNSGSVLPVEIPEGDLIYTTEDIFNSKEGHKSHLLNCPEMQQAWNEKRKKYLKDRNPLFALKEKDLLR